MNKTFLSGTTTTATWFGTGGGTVDVQQGATLDVPGHALDLQDGPWTITVDGVIAGPSLPNQAATGIALGTSVSAQNSKVTIGATGFIWETGANAVGIDIRQATDIVNSGKIYVERSGVYFESSIDATRKISVVNNATGIIHSDWYGINDKTGAALTITNAGTIFGGLDAITSDAGGGAMTLKNSGLIGEGEYGVVGGADTSITNSGTISGWLGAVFLRSSGKVTNSGTIRSQGGDGNNVAVRQIGPAAITLNNSGLIDSGMMAIWTEGAATIVNTGTIDGTMQLGGHDDKLTNTGGAINGLIDMGAGDDVLTGGSGAELVHDGAGSDTYKFGGGDDIYIAGNDFGIADGTDTVDGGAGLDNYTAITSTAAVFINLDTTAHMLGNQTVAAGTGTGADIGTDKVTNFEFVSGSMLNDFMHGGSAAETLNGLGGNDTIDGGGGDDTLNGGDGNDNLTGGLGADILSGGTGNDTFVFFAAKDSGTTATTRDDITDFAAGGDKIDLHQIDANTGHAGDDAFSWKGLDQNGGHALTKIAGELHAWWQGSQTLVEGDTNGDGKADFSIALDGHINLSAADFVL